MKKGKAFIITGLLLIIIAAALAIYNFWDSARAGREAADVMGQLLEQIDRSDGSAAENNGEMPTVTINGIEYIGYIEIQSLGIALPVQKGCSLELLKISPCLYSGSYYDDDMVLCGHNYRSQFGPLLHVDLGAEVDFTNVLGETIIYTVGNRETVQATEVQRMIDNETGNWDLTLYTCNLGGQTRCAVRCSRENGDSYENTVH